MQNVAKSANYENLLNTISILVKEATQKDFEIEDPLGQMKTFKIQSMSINILCKVNKMYLINNGAIDTKETNTDKSIMIRFWIKNKYKTIEYLAGYSDTTLDPENFKIFFYQNLNTWVNNAFRLFFGSEKSKSKYSKRTNDAVEEHIEKTDLKPEISINTVTSALEMTHRLHKDIKEVRDANTNLSKEFSIFLMADSEGRKILTKSNEFFCVYSVITFINKQSYELQNADIVYAMTEKELQQGIKKMYENLKLSVQEHDQINFLETGWYPIFMNTDATHTLFHEGIAGHLLSGKYIVEEDSKVFQVLDKDFSADPRFEILKQLTVENKPNMPNTIASYAFDHEGIRAKDIVLMDKGKVMNYLTNRNSAFRLGQKESNGTTLTSTFVEMTQNGRAIVIPEPRISNLIITSHSQKTQEDLRKNMIRYCKKNNMEFYLEIWSKEGQVFVEDGMFNLGINECDMVFLDGTRKKVWGGMLSGNLFEFIGAIQDISKETEPDDGKCGSESGWVPVHGEAPYMTLKKFNFVATKKPLKKNKTTNPKYIAEEQLA
ncbi:MAG: hypothetical protein ACD_80C00086G0005 [uncultured bacterium (gcode 4)]|uniref:Metalloprotease TldD/E C-terminal domain-containing protein n=1 Tax=uncultured bacterium (gcode 4) TaxID=1234023 RepID=K1XJD1_9BACT|nr:MAG: hypothetical protein ACD_80C00086G0005 [uncultured bacterium (gcode 4)]HBB04651.1 hypothetical protein [Candidatus Gracilibacteria bacterium]